MKAFTGEFIAETWIKNRLVMAPMISNLADPSGLTSDNHISYLEERAKGGFGLIITEYSYISTDSSKGSRNEMTIGNMDHIPKLRRLTESIHKHDSKVFIQIVHAGGKALQEKGERIIAPSPINYSGHVPAEMTEDDIESVRMAFENAAKVAKFSNFDGIEIHGAHGYLVQEFLSPSLNKRKDRYGGTFERMLSFPQEIIDSVKDISGLPVGIRLSLYEDDPDGYGPEYGLKISETLKNLDYVHFSAGRFAPPGSSASFYSDEMHIFRKLPRKPKIKTMVVGSITKPESIEAALESVDFVAMGRPALSDAFLPLKLFKGDRPIKPCIRCNQACRDLSYGEVRCTVNVYTGYERNRQVIKGLKGEITIAGAGPAGLEAALMARETGLKVVLYEKEDKIGGALTKAIDPFKKIQFDRLLNYYSEELRRTGIQIVLSTALSNPNILAVPRIEYPDLPNSGDITIDSNIFKHHDQALEIARKNKVAMSERSLDSLDRHRQIVYRNLAEKAGIIFLDHKGKTFDVSNYEVRQYDLKSAIESGISKVETYIQYNLSDFS
ncbi:MAG: oxidoreductase [Thermoplasmataceae archaeon]